MKKNSFCNGEMCVIKPKMLIFAIVLLAITVCIFVAYIVIFSILKIDDKSCKILLGGDCAYEFVLDEGGKVCDVIALNEKGAICLAKENFYDKDFYATIERAVELKIKLDESVSVVVVNCSFSSDYVYNVLKSGVLSFVKDLSKQYNKNIKLKNLSQKEFKDAINNEKNFEIDSKSYIKHYDEILTNELETAISNKLENIENLINVSNPYAELGNLNKIQSEDFQNVVINLQEFSSNYNYDLECYDFSSISYNEMFEIVKNLKEMHADLKNKLDNLSYEYNIDEYVEFAYDVKRLLIEHME